MVPPVPVVPLGLLLNVPPVPVPMVPVSVVPPVPVPMLVPVAGDIVVFVPPAGAPPEPEPAPGEGPASEHAITKTHAIVHTARTRSRVAPGTTATTQNP